MPARIPMTAKQRDALLALPTTEEEVVAHHSLDESELAAIARLRSPANQLGYALQLCCLRYPGRYFRRGELLPAIMLDHIAEQIGVEAHVIADFAKRGTTRYEQLASIKRNHGFLWLGRAGWTLSPAYDLNPVPTDLKARVLTTNIDLDEGTCSLDLLEHASEYFALTLAQARAIIKEVATVTATWRETAKALGARSAEITRMASAFEHDDLMRALAL